MRDYGAAFGWELTPSLEALAITVSMKAITGDIFIVRLLCDDYKALPPYVDFLEPITRQVGTLPAFPSSSGTFFNTNGPCICAPFNRKAYGSLHTDWQIGDWINSKADGVDWSQYATLVGILSLIQARLLHDFKGRMG